ncbi:sulfate adenylate transferase, subunit 2 [Vibrio furnissii NCTC 11218]|nr:sulfate adenylate transferase, subunit 2 [Vibrio furnissii NCTC 11218]
MDQQRLTHLKQLEAESIHIIREVAAEFANPVMMYSIGKDSSVMLHLARKAFYPGKIPFPLLHVDTDWKFRDMIAFRDATAKKYGFELLVHKNPEGMAMGINPFDHGSSKHTDIMKTQGLKQALNNTVLMPLLVARVVTKRNRVPKSVSTHSAISTIRGTQKTSVRSCGKLTTAKSTKVKAFVCSRCRTGRSWISGNTSC